MLNIIVYVCGELIKKNINKMKNLQFTLAAIFLSGTLIFSSCSKDDEVTPDPTPAGMNTIADQNSFAVCYPQGTTDSWGDNFWNVGYNFHAGVTIDDVDFIVSLASYLQSTYQLNAINTFFTGMSNGGEL